MRITVSSFIFWMRKTKWHLGNISANIVPIINQSVVSIVLIATNSIHDGLKPNLSIRIQHTYNNINLIHFYVLDLTFVRSLDEEKVRLLSLGQDRMLVSVSFHQSLLLVVNLFFRCVS